ncbi:MAG: hypothetical protein ACOYVD_10195 [Bacillota bacterium]
MKRKIYKDNCCIFQSILYTAVGLFLLSLTPAKNITNLEFQITISMFFVGAIMFIAYNQKTVEITFDKLIIGGFLSAQDVEFNKVSRVVLSKKISTARFGYTQDIHLFGKDNNKELITISTDIIGHKQLKEFINLLVKKSGASYL